jgi:hypothetical protein
MEDMAHSPVTDSDQEPTPLLAHQLPLITLVQLQDTELPDTELPDQLSSTMPRVLFKKIKQYSSSLT